MKLVCESNSQLARSQQARDTVSAHAFKGASASKYDFVKVKVWLQGGGKAHYYVLSRFLISRALTVTRIPHMKAVKIALELKKYCVDNGLLDISQAQLEEALFGVMRGRGCGDLYVARYKMVSKLHLQRRPLIIFLCGSACTGKSTLAQQLAARLNMPNVLQTDVICELLRETGQTSLHALPLWQRRGLSEEQLLKAYLEECAVVRRGINADLDKVLQDGKSFIMEGLHLEPGMYLYEFGGLCQTPASAAVTATAISSSGAPQLHGIHDLHSPNAPDAARNAASRPEAGRMVCDADAGEPPVVVPLPNSALAMSFRSEASRQSTVVASYSQTENQAAGQAVSQHEETASPPVEDISRRHRIKQKLRSKLPGWSSQEAPADSGEISAAAAAIAAAQVASPSLVKPPSPQKSRHVEAVTAPVGQSGPSGLQSSAPRRELGALFALRRTDSSGGVLQPRLDPWHIAKRVLEALNPLRATPSSEALKGMEPDASGCKDRQPQSKRGPAAAGTSLTASQSVSQSDRQTMSQSDAWHGQQSQSGNGASSSQAQCNQTALPPAHTEGILPDTRKDTAGGPLTRGTPIVSTGGGEDDVTYAAKGRGGNDGALPPGRGGWGGTGGSRGGRHPAPVFVPIVLNMDPADQHPQLQEWLWRQRAITSGECCPADALRAVTTLQQHLCAYQGRMVPVVRVSAAAFSSTLDDMHDYLLQCMQLAVDAA